MAKDSYPHLLLNTKVTLGFFLNIIIVSRETLLREIAQKLSIMIIIVFLAGVIFI